MACFYYNLDIQNGDILDSQDSRVHVDYYSCVDGTLQTTDYFAAGIYANAICNNDTIGSPIVYVIIGGVQTAPPFGSFSVSSGISCALPTPTPTPTITQTPSVTTIVCGLGTTTGSYFYTDCCGNFITGTQVGLSVSLDYTKPSNGITKTNVATSVVCPTPTPTPTVTPSSTPATTQTQTPTPTKTPALTPSPTSTPAPTPVFKLANNCDVVTLFPMGVECVTLVSPSSSISADGVLSLQITGGSAPYTISWSNGQKSQTIAGLGPGDYTAQVVDFYGDYSSTTICSLFAPTPTPTPTTTTTPTPTPSGTYSDLCVTILSTIDSILPVQYTFNGIINGKPSWISGSYLMYWDIANQLWKIQNYTLYGGALQSNTTASVPTSNWTLVGGTSSPTVNVSIGTCPSYAPFNAIISKNDSSCSNDGSIMITTTGGQSPYSFSINGGNTFTSSNVFNSLPAGNYAVIARDIIGNVVTQNVTIASTQSSVTYTVTVSNDTTSSPNVGYQLSNWSVKVNPPIPVGVTIPIVLNINTTQINNGPGSGETLNNIVVYSGSNIVSSTTNTSNSVVATRPNCSPELSTTTYNNSTYNVVLGYGYGISGTSSSQLAITSGVTGNNGCVTTVNQTISIFSSQATTNGCTCCTALNDSTAAGGINNHTLSLGQIGSTSNYVININGLPITPGSGFFTGGMIQVNNAPVTLTLTAFGGATPGGSTIGNITITGVGTFSTATAYQYQTTQVSIPISTNGTYYVSSMNGNFIGTAGNSVTLT